MLFNFSPTVYDRPEVTPAGRSYCISYPKINLNIHGTRKDFAALSAACQKAMEAMDAADALTPLISRVVKCKCGFEGDALMRVPCDEHQSFGEWECPKCAGVFSTMIGEMEGV
jgi:hypothetical protein